MSTDSVTKLSQQAFLEREAQSSQKHQYYQGEVFAMASASPAHNRIVLSITSRFYIALLGRPCQPTNSDVMVKVKAMGLITYPDCSVVCPPVFREPGTAEVVVNPRVLVEVLSPSTERFDRLTKFAHYEPIESLTDLLLVRQDQPLIEHYTRTGPGPWTPLLVIGKEAEIVFDSLDCRLSLSHIYDGVEFPEPPSPPIATFSLSPYPEA